MGLLSLVAQASAYYGSLERKGYTSASRVPRECDAAVGTKVPDSCCSGAENSAAFFWPKPYTFNAAPAIKATPNISLAIYINCEDGEPVFGEKCLKDWMIPNADASNYTGSPSRSDRCGDKPLGCEHVVRGAGCWRVNHPSQIGEWLLTHRPFSAIAAYAPALLTVPDIYFAWLPPCSSM